MGTAFAGASSLNVGILDFCHKSSQSAPGPFAAVLLCAQFQSLSAPKVISITRPGIGRVDSTNLLDDPDGSVLGVHSHDAALC